MECSAKLKVKHGIYCKAKSEMLVYKITLKLKEKNRNIEREIKKNGILNGKFKGKSDENKKSRNA